jgi:polyisoprenyl-teichoic acid--peptidoglycan teichoic acid transferase
MTEAPRQKPFILRLFGWALYLLFLLIFLAAGTAWGWISKSELAKQLLIMEVTQQPAKEVFERESLTLLILGCDEERYYQGRLVDGERVNPTLRNGSPVRRKYARSDMMLVARLDFEANRITGLSIPRDTECRLPGYRRMKINAYHAIAEDGQEDDLTRRAVEHLLPGVHIDQVVTLDFEAFQHMVDATGGVTVAIDKAMKYDDFAGDVHVDFKPGIKTLNGYDAMMFVRYRHGDNDFKRQERQKQFMAAFKDSVLQNKAALPAVLNEAMNVLNGALDARQVASLALFARKVRPADIQLGQVPVKSGRGTYLRVDEEKLAQALTEAGLVDAVSDRVSLR